MSEQPPPYGGWQSPTPPPGQPAGQPPVRQPPGPQGWGQPSPPPGGAFYGPVPGQPTWSPPPKPGVVPLRPLGVGELIDGSVQTMRQNPKVMLGLSAITTAVAVVLSTVVLALGITRLTAALEPDSPDPAVLTGGVISATLVPAALQALASVVLTGLLIVAVSEAVIGRRPSIGEVWQRSRRRVPALIGLALLTSLLLLLAVGLPAGGGALLFLLSDLAGGLGLAAGVLGGIVLAVFLGVRLAFAAPALLLEQLGVVGAMRRSWRLGRGSFWRVLGILLLTGLVAAVANGLLSLPFSLIGGVVGGLLSSGSEDPTGLTGVFVSTGVGGVGTILASTVTAPFSAAVTALLYIDLRMRREGLDVALAEAASRPAPVRDT